VTGNARHYARFEERRREDWMRQSPSKAKDAGAQVGLGVLGRGQSMRTAVGARRSPTCAAVHNRMPAGVRSADVAALPVTPQGQKARPDPVGARPRSPRAVRVFTGPLACQSSG